MIEVSHDGDIAILRMAHGKANAQSVEFCDAVAMALREQDHGPARAVVLTGTGSIFSAGVDLVRISAEGSGYVRRFLPALNGMFQAAFDMKKPLVAAVNGHAIAGGCVLACCADVRIMARGQGHIGITEILVGVPFPALAFEVMRFAAHPQYLADMALSGAVYLCDEARVRGLVDEVVEAGDLMSRATAAARTLAALSPAAFAATKEQLRQQVKDNMAKHAARVDRRVEEVWASDQTLQNIRDFVAKTIKKS